MGLHAAQHGPASCCAQVLVGGVLGKHAFGGQFYQPTVLVGVTSDMRIWRWALLSVPDTHPAPSSGCLGAAKMHRQLLLVLCLRAPAADSCATSCTCF